jgi:hypothetical protein
MEETTKSVSKKLTKQDFIELANYLYERYEHKRKVLNKTPVKEIIKEDTNRENRNK